MRNSESILKRRASQYETEKGFSAYTEENEAEADARMMKFLAESRDLRQEVYNDPD